MPNRTAAIQTNKGTIRFELLESDAPKTYEQVGEKLGLSKQRVRQIEQTALAKLRSETN